MLESLEKLRKWLNYKVNRFDACSGAIVLNTDVNPDELYELAYAIQAEVDERYMPLPLDADGVPIRVGDEVTYGVGQKPYCVYAVSYDAAWLNNSTTVDVIALMKFQAEQCRHVKQRTVEDVLHDFGNDYAAFLSGIYPFENAKQYDVIAKYAAELRMRDMND